ncbi:MAG: hypothetical protein PHF86_10055 [Candidatus Nanoarchaeia archaeon]|jgi:hypothetical protein|nr:hypothetical protein [Candidatus Nanoarchaeia archaeon]
MKTCVFMRWYNENVFDEIKKIKNESGYDVYLSLDYKLGSILNITDICPIHYYNEDDFNKSKMLSWAKICNKPGSMFRFNPEVSLIDFKNKINYDYYWLIEGDVKLAGDYNEFFEEYKSDSHDLLAYNIMCDQNIDQKYLTSADYDYLKNAEQFDNTNLYQYINVRFKSFMVVSRFSKKLLDALEDSFKKGILGTNENIVANVCYYNNMTMRSFNNSYFKEENYSDTPKVFNPNAHSFFHSIKR